MSQQTDTAQKVPDAAALERHGRRILRAAQVQERFGRHDAALEMAGRARALLGRARKASKAQNDDKRLAQVDRRLRAVGKLSRRLEARAGAPGWKRALWAAAAAVPLLWIHGIWASVAVSTWAWETPVRWWVVAGLGASLLVSILGVVRSARPWTLTAISAALLCGVSLASFWKFPTLGTGAVVAHNLDSMQMSYVVCMAAISAPVLLSARWLSALIWIPLGTLAGWCVLPMVVGLWRQMPIEDLPLIVEFWGELPQLLQPLWALTFVYTPAAALAVLASVLVMITASDREPAPESLLRDASPVPVSQDKDAKGQGGEA